MSTRQPALPADTGPRHDAAVTLDITSGVPHVFRAYHQILDEAAAAPGAERLQEKS